MIRFLQVNLNRNRTVQDLFTQHLRELDIGIGIVSEPNSVPSSPLWFSDLSYLAAITWSPEMAYPCVLFDRGNGFVAVSCGNLVIISCYFSPNMLIGDFVGRLDSLSTCIRKYSGSYIIVAGDFNAKHTLWDASANIARGDYLLEMTSTLELRLANIGDDPMCEGPRFFSCGCYMGLFWTYTSC